MLPFGGKYLSEEFKGLDAHQETVHALFVNLSHLQELVAGTMPYNKHDATKACVDFCILYNALEVEATSNNQDFLWNFKPKGHLLQELVEYQSWEHGSPNLFWTYRDESWCGNWARHSKRRGGANTATISAKRFLDRFRALAPDL